MKAAFYVSKEKIEIREVPRPSPRKSDCIVEVEACGICGSDTWWLRDGSSQQIQGHEISGTISEVGEEVRGWDVGDRVVVYDVVGCGECEPCKRGMDTYCLNNPRGLGGGFAEYVSVPQRSLLPLDPSIDPIMGCLITDNVGTPMRALGLAKMPARGVVAVWGLGPLGLVAVQGARILGARKVIGVDPIPLRRETARKLGADIVLDPLKEDPSPISFEVTDGYGVDLSFCALKQDSIAETASKIVRKGGWFVSVDGHAPIGGQPEIYASGVFYFAKTDYPRYVELVNDGQIKLEPIVTHVLPLERIQEAFVLRFKHPEQSIKVVVGKATKPTT